MGPPTPHPPGVGYGCESVRPVPIPYWVAGAVWPQLPTGVGVLLARYRSRVLVENANRGHCYSQKPQTMGGRYIYPTPPHSTTY